MKMCDCFKNKKRPRYKSFDSMTCIECGGLASVADKARVQMASIRDGFKEAVDEIEAKKKYLIKCDA